MAILYSLCPACRRMNRVNTEKSPGGRPICGNCKAELPLHGSVNELDGSTLADLIAKSRIPVVVDFWAPWCGPCRTFAPTFESVASRYGSEAVFAKLNTQDHPEAASGHAIRSIPTLILFADGREKDRQTGLMLETHLVQWVRSYAEEAA